MTGRQRLNSVLHKRPTDRLPWSTLVDDATLSALPEELRGNGGIDFYRHLGCDIFLLNGWNTRHRFTSPRLRWPEGVEISSHHNNGRQITEWTTPEGTLTAVYESGHPVRYPVDSLEAVRIYRAIWEGACFTEQDESETMEAIDRLIGHDGVMTRFWGPSAIPRLLENDMGTENFYYLLADHPDEMDGLIHTIHEQTREAFRILARGPWESVTLVENTSTFYISPDVYRRYNMPHQRDFVRTVKEAGKPALIHMCGHVRNILDPIRETGCDGIHFLTPPPTGDTPWEIALDVLGEDTIIIGCLDPSVFARGTLERIPAALDELITPRLREANFVLNPTADGIRVDYERFRAVRDWMENNR